MLVRRSYVKKCTGESGDIGDIAKIVNIASAFFYMGLTLLVGDVILSAHRCAGIDAKKGLAGVAARVRPEREACIFLLEFLRKRYKLYKKMIQVL